VVEELSRRLVPEFKPRPAGAGHATGGDRAALTAIHGPPSETLCWLEADFGAEALGIP
jgi:hypothetical protein